MSVADRSASGAERVERWNTTDGVTVVGSSWGTPGQPAVLLLHGGGQTRHAWKGAGEALAAAGFHAVSLDTRGHGDSGWAPDGDYGFDPLISDLAAVIEQLGGRAVALVGASMGGATSLTAVGEGVIEASALVLVDVAPKTELDGVERVRNFMLQSLDGFASLDEVADAVAAYQPHRPRPANPAGLLRNVRLGEDGRYRWHWDPQLVAADIDHEARSLRLQHAARNVRIPTLLVRGMQSDVLTQDGVDDFKELVPHAEAVDVAGAAHMVAGDENDVFVDALISFLERTLLS